MALVAQVGQAPPIGYPPGQYPGRYPGGSRLPIPRRGTEGPRTTPKQPPKPAKYLAGVIRGIDAKSLVMEASDKRVITLQVSVQTRFLREGQPIRLSDLRTGDHVEVQAHQDEEGNFLAVQVTLQPGARQEEEEGEDAGAPKPAGRSSTATAAPAVPDPDDPGPPALKRGKPPQPTKTKRAEAIPANAPRASTTVERRSAAANSQPAEAATAPPPRDPRAELVEKARAAAEAFSEKLPNYVCQQFTTRSVSRSRPASWETQDVVSAAVVYEDGKESYRNVAINGKATGKSMEQLPGAWSTGEFGTVLLDLFSPATAARFHYRRQSSASGLPADVYSFEVAQPNSHWNVMMPSQSIMPAYRGSIWIDKGSARVLRIEMQAAGLPEEFPLDAVESAIDYAFVPLGTAEGTAQFLLPVHAETLSCHRGSSICSRNVIDFRNYRRFFGESKVIFDQ